MEPKDLESEQRTGVTGELVTEQEAGEVVVATDVVEERVIETPPLPPPVPSEVTSAEVRTVTEDELVEVAPDGAVHRRVDRVEQAATARNPLVPALIAILLLVLAGLAVAWYLTRESDVEVPSVVGLPLDQAVERLESDGLKTDITTGQSADTEPGTVFDQDPAAGTTVDEGATVQIVTSQGPGEAPVPNVVGVALPAARTTLESQGLVVTVSRTPSDRPSGEVLAQDPAAGTELAEGGSVRLEVSQGAPAVTVPNAVGLDEVSARDRIVAEGLRPVVTEIFSEDPEGQVVSQLPAAGTEVADGGRVQLRVSKGSATTTVPSAIGSLQEEAELAVTEAGLVPNVVRVPSAEPEGTVVAQNPTGGSARRGSTVRLNVSTGTPR